MWSAVRVGAAARQLLRAAGTSLPPARRRQHSAPHRGLPIDAMPTPGDLPGTPSAARLHEYVDMRHRQLGPVFRDRIGPVSAVFVADPDEMRRTFGLEGKYPVHVLPEPWVHYNQLFGVKRGLFFMDGADWLKMRRLMNPLMLRTDQGGIFFSACQHVAESLVSKWKAGGTQVVDDLEAQLYKWSLDTVIAVLMGPLYEIHAPKWNDEVEYLAHNIHKVFLETGNMSLISAKDAQEGQLPVWKRFITTVDASLNTARSLVLQMIPLSTGESGGLLKGMVECGMSEEDIIKVVIDFIIAAGDTTALSLQWTLYLLAENPLTQGQVAAELTQETDILQSALVRGVVREALRLYPVAPFLTRIMPESCVIGGYELPPKELVLLSLFTSGRNAKNFPQPERFWPERWLRTSHSTNEVTYGSYKAVHNPHASMPFAMGARSCIGRKLAETQMITTLAAILRDFKIELLNTENIDMVLRMVAVPSIPLKLGLRPRTRTSL